MTIDVSAGKFHASRDDDGDDDDDDDDSVTSLSTVSRSRADEARDEARDTWLDGYTSRD